MHLFEIKWDVPFIGVSKVKQYSWYFLFSKYSTGNNNGYCCNYPSGYCGKISREKLHRTVTGCIFCSI